VNGSFTTELEVSFHSPQDVFKYQDTRKVDMLRCLSSPWE
jgi:hypothetical protein